MVVKCIGIKDGWFLDQYGDRGTHFDGSIPTYSIPIEISDVSNLIKSFAIVVDNPTSDMEPYWTHWVLCNLTERKLKSNSSKQKHSYIEGLNSWGTIGYGGMIPSDLSQMYFVRVYALDILVDLEEGFTRKSLEKQMVGHILEQTVIKARYDKFDEDEDEDEFYVVHSRDMNQLDEM